MLNLTLVENYDSDGRSTSVTCWYENGQVEFQNNEDDTSYSYAIDGTITSKGVRVGDVNKGGYALISEYFDNGVLKKETKNYYVDGLLHGYEKSFYNTGEIRREVDYTNGFRNKIVKTYKKNGEVTIK